MNKRILKLFMAFMMTLTSFQMAWANVENYKRIPLVISPEDGVFIQRVDNEDGDESFRFDKCELARFAGGGGIYDCQPLTDPIQRGNEELYNIMFSENLHKNLEMETSALVNDLKKANHADHELIETTGVYALAGVLILTVGVMAIPTRPSPTNTLNSQLRKFPGFVIAVGALLQLAMAYFLDAELRDQEIKIDDETITLRVAMDRVLDQKNIELSADTKVELRQAFLRAIEKTIKETRVPSMNGTI